MEIEGIIIETKKKDEEIIKKVKDRKANVCIYGCGDIGIMLYECLRLNGIRVDFFVVDDEYCTFDQCRKLPVKKLSLLKQIKEHVDVFVGFANFNKALKKLRDLDGNINVYCISNPYIYLKEYDIDSKFFRENETEFSKAYSLFEDELSKKIFVAYLNTRINKNYKYMLPFGKGKTYFNNEIFELSDDEVYVDCGAYNGDSVKSFLESVEMKYKSIYAIEPDKENFEEIKRYVNDQKIKNIFLINSGVWKKKDKLGFSETGKQEGSIIEKSTEHYIEVDALDNILHGEKATLVKLSVQGAEESALIGAENMLKKDKPKLAITIFMKPDALIKLPNIIKKINPEYKLYLRCEEAFFAKVILYAKVEE